MSKIVIFGATGNVGLCVTEYAVKKGLKVRVSVRSSAKVPAELKDKVEIHEGNVLEPDSVRDAVEGMDGVVIALGTRNSLEATSDMSEGTKNIIDAMREKNVKVVSACLSAFLLFKPGTVPPLFKDINDDHQRMYDALKESGLDYVAVMPPHIADEPPTTELVPIPDATTPSPISRVVSKYDLARFLVDSLTQPEYYRKTVSVANKPKDA